MDNIINSVKDLLAKLTFLPQDELKLALLGGIAIVVLFLIACVISAGSKMNGLRKKIQSLIGKVVAMQRIDETNVEDVYDEMTHMPLAVQKGWGNFLDQRNGYPSDYMPARDCLGEKAYSGKNTAGIVLFSIFGVIVWALIAFLTAGVCAADLQNFGIKDFTGNFSLVASILATVLVPVALYVIGFFILRGIYGKQRKRLELCFASLQDILDEKVLVSGAEPAPYDAESLEEIAARVDKLIDGRMEDEETIEVLKLPEGIEEELPAENTEEVILDMPEEIEDEPEEEEEEEKVEPVDSGIGDIIYDSDEDEEEIEESEEEPVEEPEEEEVEEETEEEVEEEETVEEPAEEPVEEEPAEEEVEEEPEEEKAQETEEVEEEPVEEEEPVMPAAPAEEPEQVPPDQVILTEEEEERYLAILPVVVGQAIADPNVKKSELEEIAVIIDGALQNNFKDPADQAILIECLQQLADKFYGDALEG